MTTIPPGPPAGPITREQATAIAAQAISGLKDGVTFALVSDATIETDAGWVFFFGTAESLLSDDPRLIVPGTGPLIVEKQDGRLAFLTTSVEPDVAIAAYEQERAAGGAPPAPER